MKPVTKKILESGLLDKHTIAMLDRWGASIVRHGSDEHPVTEGQKIETKEQLEQFVEELEELLDKEEEVMRETPLDWPASGKPTGYQIKGNPQGLFIGCLDSMGRLVVNPMTRFKRGLAIINRVTDQEFKILEIDFFYQGEKVIAQLLTLE